MTTDVERLVLQMSADVRAMERGLARAQAASDRAAGKIEGRFKKMNQGIVAQFQDLNGQLSGAIAALGVGIVANELRTLADSYTNVTNQLRSYQDVLGPLDAAQKRLTATAIDAQAGFEDLAAVVAPAARAARELGRSGDDVFKFAEAVGKGAAIANTGTAAVSGAITQLGQAIASPVVQLGEFNSVIEGTPRLAQAFADGVEGANGSISTLRKLIGSGQVSGAELFTGLLSQLPKLNAEFAAADQTIGSAFVNLRTRITAYVGELNEATGASAEIVDVLKFVETNLEAMAEASVVAAAAIGGALAGRALAGAIVEGGKFIVTTVGSTGALSAQTIAANLSAAAMARLNAAMAWFGGPIGLAVAALGSAVAFYAVTMRDGAVAARELDGTMQAARPAIDAYRKAIEQAAAANEKDRDAAVRAAVATRVQAQAAIDAARAKLAQAVATAKSAEARLAEAEAADAVAASVGDPAAALAGSAGVALATERRRVAFARLAGQMEALGQVYDEVRKADEQLKAITNPTAATPTTPEGSATATGGRTRADAAREVAALERQAALSLARARNDRDAVEAAERRADAEERAAAYQRAGLAPAEAQLRAEREITAETDARAALMRQSLGFAREELALTLAEAQGNAVLAAALRDQIEVRRVANQLRDAGATAAEAEAEAQRQVNALRAVSEAYRAARLEERDLENERARAAARGDEATVQRLTRELELRRRIADLEALGVSREEARDRAAREVVDEDRAAMQGRFRDAFRGGVRAALDGDLKEYVRNWWQDRLTQAFDRSLDAIADSLFALFDQAISRGRATETGQGSTLGRILGGLGNILMPGGGIGGRALGGTVSAGQLVRVGEKGPELVRFGAQGSVVPAGVLRALQTTPTAAPVRQETSTTVKVQISLAGANGDATIARIAREQTAIGVAEGLRAAERNAPARNRRFELLGS